jgi:prepilin-type N-terminal cleavage/methylation domain-containing protein
MARGRTIRARSAGFTLIELVMVMVILGVLAVVALPKMVDTTAWRLRAYSDDLVSQTLSARRMALSQRRPIVATITQSGVVFAYAAGGTLATLNCPVGATPCIAEAGTRSISFNAANSGSTVTSTGTTLTITVSGGSYSRALQVANETGHVLAPT